MAVGLAHIRDSGKWFLINKKGRWIYPPFFVCLRYQTLVLHRAARDYHVGRSDLLIMTCLILPRRTKQVIPSASEESH